MVEVRSLTEIQRKPAAAVLDPLKAGSENASKEAGLALVRQAAEFGLSVRDYLTLAIDPNAGDAKFGGLNGYEAALAYLNLPVKDAYEVGVVLQAAGETFQKFPGTRAMFPEVIDDMLRWQNRQSQIETVAPLLANSRTISGTELISTVVNDDSAERITASIAEGARIPVRSIRTSQTSVGIFKHGSGYRTTYEFNRRARLDILTPFANRVARELEMSKVKAATSILVNGDGVNSAAAVVAQSGLAGYDSGASGQLQYKAMLTWLVAQAQNGVPVDTIVGNFDAYLRFLWLFLPVTAMSAGVADMAAERGVGPTFNFSKFGFDANITFALSSTAPANKLIGFVKGETLEELVEAGSQISESESAIQNQTVTYVRTESTGYKLAFADTRSILNFGA
jgi:hypothetical protein